MVVRIISKNSLEWDLQQFIGGRVEEVGKVFMKTEEYQGGDEKIEELKKQILDLTNGNEEIKALLQQIEEEEANIAGLSDMYCCRAGFLEALNLSKALTAEIGQLG